MTDTHPLPNTHPLPDIESLPEIRALVDAFYGAVRADPLLGPVFAARVGAGGWPAHLQRMYTFWNTVLRHEPGYKGSPFAKHADLPVGDAHFERWVALWDETVDARYAGPTAELAKARAGILAVTFGSKLRHLRGQA